MASSYAHQKKPAAAAAVFVVIMMLTAAAGAVDEVECQPDTINGDSDLGASISEVIRVTTTSAPYQKPVLSFSKKVTTKGKSAYGYASCASSLGVDGCGTCLLEIVQTLQDNCMNARRATVNSPEGCYLYYVPVN